MKDKIKTIYICNTCGETSPKWVGKCQSCGEWNTMVEDVVREMPSPSKRRATVPMSAKPLTEIDEQSVVSLRLKTGMNELDRVLGGGIVKGALMLLSGEPGAGKSTLLLQICSGIARDGTVLYISGEESVRQIKLRAVRLGINSASIVLAAETAVEDICAVITSTKPKLAVIDSIQTMQSGVLQSSPGSVTQVKECTAQLLQVAKQHEIPVFLVGHVNKDGAIAGPKVMEHAVDTVLYFEGDRTLPYRILRSAKNRYGSTNELGLFDMTQKGLVEVLNPSMALLEGRPDGISGSCVLCTMEGSRPIFTEVQALIVKSSYPSPRRTTSGFDYNRANLIIAILEKRAGYSFGALDIYINVIGGIKLEETAGDLAVAMAIVSGLNDYSIDGSTLFVGELGLGGELRAVSHIEQRLQEAKRLGFKKVIIPHNNKSQSETADIAGVEVVGIKYVKEAIKELS